MSAFAAAYQQAELREGVLCCEMIYRGLRLGASAVSPKMAAADRTLSSEGSSASGFSLSPSAIAPRLTYS